MKVIKEYQDASIWPYRLERPFNDMSFNPFRPEAIVHYGCVIPILFALFVVFGTLVLSCGLATGIIIPD